MAQFLYNQIDSSIDEVIHMLIKTILKLGHISILARLNKIDVLYELILLKQSLCWKDIKIDLYKNQEFQYFLFVSGIIIMGISESESKVISSLNIIINVNTLSSF